ncbi:SH3 domain-containing protein [Yunchengibacter salinarum]|uniref:SH3 domain-containing protein n=1 Tax=Yunchengibacter salinarum TaxID=3133399 RepID=UPI0035B691B8
MTLSAPLSNRATPAITVSIGHRLAALAGLLCLLCALLAGSFSAAAQDRVGPSGNPIPRFVSLDTDRAYMRSGPGTQYPVDWVYQRRDLPLKVVDEHGPWRQVEDHDGTKGWIHVQLLSGRRTAMITGHTRRLHHAPDPTAPVAIIAEAGAIGTLSGCEMDWCALTLQGREGWLRRAHIWGVLPGERPE